MLDQSFSEKNLWRLLAKGDRKKYQLGDTRAQCRAKLSDIAHRISDDKFSFSHFLSAVQSHGRVFSPSCTDDDFAIKKLNDNIKRHYSISSADRNVIVPQVIALAREAPFHLVKLDIQKFFDSVNREALLNELFADSSLSYTSRKLLKKLFEAPQLKNQLGLPRGLSISSTLAEFALRDFDSKCRRLPYCYHFARYVDDMLFFCHERPNNIQEDVGQLLPWGLKLNMKKFSQVDINPKGLCSIAPELTDRIGYLGYQFIFPTSAEKKLRISIHPSKINKLKTRIILALRNYISNTDYPLLLSRIRFLSSNFRVTGSKQKIGKLYSGVFYNHRHIDKESLEGLNEIDQFLRKAVFSKKSTLGRKLYPLLTDSQRRILCSNSLQSGHEKRIYRHFTHKDLKLIKGAWSHA
jgi:hypothetical protein